MTVQVEWLGMSEKVQFCKSYEQKNINKKLPSSAVASRIAERCQIVQIIPRVRRGNSLFPFNYHQITPYSSQSQEFVVPFRDQIRIINRPACSSRVFQSLAENAIVEVR